MDSYKISGVGGGGAGVQAHPQKSWFVKYLGKIPETPGKSDAQLCLTWKHGAQRLRKKYMKLFFAGCTKKGLHDLCGRKYVGKSRPKTFRASLGKFEQKSFAPPKICLLLQLWLQYRVTQKNSHHLNLNNFWNN